MLYDYCCDVMSIMTDWIDSESIKLLHLHTALNCYCMCVTFASAVHYHSLHDAIVGLTNGKCTATPIIYMGQKCGVASGRDPIDRVQMITTRILLGVGRLHPKVSLLFEPNSLPLR